MQRFKDFTKKSGKVASAILSAAMVTSMVAGTNVVYAANTEVTTEETDVTADAVSKDTQKQVDAITAALKEIPVNAGVSEDDIISSTSLTNDVISGVAKKVKKSLDISEEKAKNYVETISGASFIITEKPEKDKAGKAELTFKYAGNKYTVDYTVASGKDREAALTAAIEKKAEEKAAKVTTTDAVAFANDVLNDVTATTDAAFGIKLYADVATGAAVTDDLKIETPEERSTGSVKGNFKVKYYDDTLGANDIKELGEVTVNVNKTLPSYTDAAKTGKKDFETYLDTVKCISSVTTEGTIKNVAKKFADDNIVTVSAVMYTEKTSATKDTAGKAEVTATIKSAYFGGNTTTTEGAIKTVTIRSDEEQADLIFSDLVKYAKSSSGASEDDFYEDFAKAFNEDNTKINATKDLDADDWNLLEAMKGVYGTIPGTASVKFEVENGKPVAKITVKFDKVDEKRETVELAGTVEAPKGHFEEKDGKKYFYDANGELVKNRYIQSDESGDGCYWASADGSVYQDRLSYDPSGKEVIYFDADGRMVFDKFVVAKKDMNGNPLEGNPVYFFDSEGRMYVNQTTYGSGKDGYDANAMYYINEYGVLLQNGWYKTADGNITYAAADGKLTTSQWGLDQFGRKVYFQANGFLAKGLITDGVKYYQLDETDGHLVGEF